MSWALVRLELLRETRSRDAATTLVLTGGLVAIVADLAFHDVDARAEVASGTLWLGLAFAASLGLARGSLADPDRAVRDALLAEPVPRGSVVLASAAVNAILLLALAALLVPFQVVLGGHAPRPLVAPVVVLGVVGLAAAGTLLGAVAARARARGAMLPLLLLPVAAPVLIAGLHGTSEALLGAGWDALRSELLVLAGFDVAMVSVALLVAGSALEG